MQLVQPQIYGKCKTSTRFQRFSMKRKDVKCLLQFSALMACWNEIFDILLSKDGIRISFTCLSFLKVGTRKFKIAYVAHIIFPLHGVLNRRNSVCKGPVARKEFPVFSCFVLSLQADIYLIMLQNPRLWSGKPCQTYRKWIWESLPLSLLSGGRDHKIQPFSLMPPTFQPHVLP